MRVVVVKELVINGVMYGGEILHTDPCPTCVTHGRALSSKCNHETYD